MEHRKDIYVLTMVALVAVVAIFTMSQAAPEEESDFISAATGRPIAVTATPTASRSAQPLDVEGNHDFNANGRIDIQDHYRLRDAVQDQQCPARLDCDLNNDGILDERDIGLLGTLIRTSTPAVQANAVAAPVALHSRSDSDLSVATTLA